MRITSKVNLEIEIPEKFGDASIAPMLILPFIENCFKHGISSHQESKINISLKVDQKKLILTTKNGIFKSNENTPEGNASGIGLQNTKRRLDLLYGNNYELDIKEDNSKNEYQVNLKINL